MCGIVGIISKNKISKGDVEAMNNSIIHRGPDSSGFYFEDNIGLAMRRLKIIDLSGGDQPIRNEDGKIMVFFNGEIYNYRELRKELIRKNHKFKSKSDTEVLIHGYEEWGITGLFDKIEGMFAFSIYDKEKNKMYIARDRFGEKPLYYFKNKNSFYFASELKALIKFEDIPKKVDPNSLFHYLAIHHVPGENTIFERIHRLRAGFFLEINTKNLEMNNIQYWKLEERKIFDSFGDALKKTRELVEKAVRERMMADVPVGAFLSGGIDSSIMVGLMARHNFNLKTFSIGFEKSEFDESEFSREVAEHFKTDHHHFVFSDADALENLPEVIKYMDEPIGDQALLPVLLLSKEASKYVKVVLGGEGADEIFAGYDYYRSYVNKRSLRSILNILRKKPEEFIDEKKCETSSGFPLISNMKDRLNLIDKSCHENINIKLREDKLAINKWMAKIKDSLKKAQFTDIYSWLIDDLLIKYDRMAMAASLEGRAPYLDSELAEYVFNLPTNYKWCRNQSKYILREAFNDILPSKILTRKKHGFNLPMSDWLRGNLKKELLMSSNLNQPDLINNEHYKRLIENHLSKKEDRGRLLYSILVYRLWFKNIM